MMDENQMEDIQWGVPSPLPFSAIQAIAPTGWGHGFGNAGSGFGGFGGQTMPTTTQTQVPPLMLDSTWQSFVEQLGF